jgi:hypothetical protein
MSTSSPSTFVLPFANNFRIGLGFRHRNHHHMQLVAYIEGLLKHISSELSLVLPKPIKLIWDDRALQVIGSHSLGAFGGRQYTIATLTLDIAMNGLPVRATWPGIESELHSVTAIGPMFGHMFLNPTVAAIVAFVGGVHYVTPTQTELTFTEKSFVGGDRIVVYGEGHETTSPAEGHTLSGKELP